MTGTITRAGAAVSLIALLAACEQMGTGPTTASVPADDPMNEEPVDEIVAPTDGAGNEILDE